MTLRDLLDQWATTAVTLRRYAAGEQAATLEACSVEMSAVLEAIELEPLALEDAARESGYSAAHLRRLLAAGTVQNVGSADGPRIRRGDLPRKPGRLTQGERGDEVRRHLRMSS